MLPKKVDYTSGIDTSALASEKNFVTLKAEVGKLDINKLVNVSTTLNNSKQK